MVAPLAHALLFVSDVPRMTQFYAGVFGLVPEQASADFVRLVPPGGGGGIALHKVSAQVSGPIATPPVWREDTYIKLCFAVPDVAAMRDQIAQAGGATRDPWHWEDRTYSECVDPEGNRLQIFGPK